MGNFNDRGGRFGGNRFGKPSFGKKSWGGGRDGDREVTLHKATCVKCGTACEVPFKPLPGKPVFCKECFGKTGGREGGERGARSFQKRDFSAHGAPRPQFDATGTNSGAANVAVLKQLESLNAKLDRLIQAVETLASRKAVTAKQELGEVITAAVTKKESKKKKSAKK